MNKMGKKDEEMTNPYQHVDRSTALQEAKKFHETPLKARICSETCTKVIYLANQGEEFTTTEATDFFFAMTKLFQNNDITLRRMCYLTIKVTTTVLFGYLTFSYENGSCKIQSNL